ncbi:hypothetical protein [Novosphingobium sp. TH158]|uniref:hypothetical protein n=1 Tax=Novosphingobium sp. TH158 TaxID=2067455 RepID=UPI000C7E03C4|nr:hypothetical protein [Novosphingobium sp. TH158]PLK26699.1 hypothetical protein C0V78_07220 [Novosphingobium sp. TH158]
MTGPWTFNIIYTPGTVAYLAPLVHSLLHHSDACFRLVDNGCMPPERDLLAALAEASPRLAFHELGASRCLPHGEVLDALRLLPVTGPFAFMDSDIVASGPFMASLHAGFEGSSAVFSGPPVWLGERDGVFRKGYRRLDGEYLWRPTGECLGCTYVAAYRPDALAGTISRHGAGFAEAAWLDLPQETRQVLVGRRLEAGHFDTGKLVNALLPGTLTMARTPTLHHIGGFSFVAGTQPNSGSKMPGLLRALLGAWRYRHGRSQREAVETARRRIDRRDRVRRYFVEFLRAQACGAPEPTPPPNLPADIATRLHEAADALRANHILAQELRP